MLAPESVVTQFATTWDVIAEHTQVMLCLGGVPVKNTGTDSGGSADHPVPDGIARALAAGVRMVSVSLLRDDLPGLAGAAPLDAAGVRELGRGLGADLAPGLAGSAGSTRSARASGSPDRTGGGAVGWLPIRPGTDVAFLLGLIGCLDADGAIDDDFLRRYCVGGEALLADVRGERDGQVKDARWAASICGWAPMSSSSARGCSRGAGRW